MFKIKTCCVSFCITAARNMQPIKEPRHGTGNKDYGKG